VEILSVTIGGSAIKSFESRDLPRPLLKNRCTDEHCFQERC
jgi:hypothetical protein